MKKYIPNILTTYRLISAILIPFIFFYSNYYILVIILISAILSDLVDGFLARKWNVESKYGKVVDMIADKALALLSSITFIITISKYYIITLLLEFMIIAINTLEYLKDKNLNNFKSSLTGKIKTWFLFVSLLVGFLSFKIVFFKYLILPFVIITALVQIITCIDYLTIYKNLKVLK